MRHTAVTAALENALPNEPRSAFHCLMSSLEDIKQAAHEEAKHASIVDKALQLSDTVLKGCSSQTSIHASLEQLLMQVANVTGATVVSTEGLSGVISSLSGFFKKRKPNGDLPSEDSDYQKRKQAVAKFISEMDKTYLSSSWLNKQKFVTTPVKAGDISTHFVIDGQLGNTPLKNVDIAKHRVQTFVGKWETVISDLHNKVKAIDTRIKAQTKGAALDDKEAIQKVHTSIKELNALPDPMDKLPRLEGTSLGNKIFSVDKHGFLEIVVKAHPENISTLPAMTKEDVMHAAALVKMMLKDDWAPEMKWYDWLDHSDGSDFSHWIYDADYDAYEEYYGKFHHQRANEKWTDGTHDMFDVYPLATAIIKWIDRSVV